MRIAFCCFLIVLVGAVRPAFAHRLDEYLQAAKISVDRGHVCVELDLTPGVAVLDRVLADIDADHDGNVSAAERQAYARRVRDDLVLMVDDKAMALEPSVVAFPGIAQMKEGAGTIALRFDADVPVGSGSRVLAFENDHLREISVYLVNCFVPSDPGIQIASQNRNYNQTIYRVGYTQSDAPIGRLAGEATTAGAQATSLSLFASYVRHGIGHILMGYDHLLFVSALVLAATTLWDLIKVVSAFTIAHTITLTLAALGIVDVSEQIVEPLIAASIVVVALQNVFWPEQARGWGRLAVAFFFGLFHGLGFAGGLLDAMRELPPGTMLVAILAFSLGVELGHQMIVVPLFVLLKVMRDCQPGTLVRTNWSTALQRYGSAAISLAGAYYLWIAMMPAF